MLKTLLSFAVIALCGAAGKLIGKRCAEREETLFEMCFALDTVKHAVLGRSATFFSVLEELAKKTHWCSAFFSGVVKRGRESPADTVSGLWNECSGLLPASLSKEDRRLVGVFGEGLELLCTSGNAAKTDEHIQELQLIAIEARKKGSEKQKVYVTVGFLTGIIITVLFY